MIYRETEKKAVSGCGMKPRGQVINMNAAFLNNQNFQV